MVLAQAAQTDQDGSKLEERIKIDFDLRDRDCEVHKNTHCGGSN
jgi:hypothetical protein